MIHTWILYRKEVISMGGFFGVVSKQSCTLDLFFGVDYHSHLGTRRGGMAVYEKGRGFARSIHNIENSPFRTKFDSDLDELTGTMGIGCISDRRAISASAVFPKTNLSPC